MRHGAAYVGRPLAVSRMKQLALIALLALAACHKADNEPGPGGVSVGEARQLDEAAAMVESEAPPAQQPTG